MQVEDRYEWFEYPQAEPGNPVWRPEYSGFRVRVLISANLTELRAETVRYLASRGPDVDQQDAYWQHVAPWIVAWNLEQHTESGERAPVPAPGQEGGSWESILLLEPELASWVQSVVHFGYIPAWRDALQNRRNPYPIVTWPPRPIIDEDLDVLGQDISPIPVC